MDRSMKANVMRVLATAIILWVISFQARAQSQTNFTGSAAYLHVTIVQGGSKRAGIRIAPAPNFREPDTLELIGAPNGVTGRFGGNPAAVRGRTLTLAVAPVVPLGTYRLVVRGTAAGSQDVPIDLRVVPPLPLSTVLVDPTQVPDFTTLPGPREGLIRSVTSLSDAHGRKAHFVQNELIVSTENPFELAEFLDRRHGQVLSVINLRSSTGAQGKQHYLVRVDPTGAQTAGLPADMHTANPNATGVLMFADQQGLELFAVAANEAAHGLEIGLNWVMQPDAGFLGGVSTESPTGPAGFDQSPYNSNVFTWRHMNGLFGLQTGDPAIGVTYAWQGLEMAGKLQNKVKAAIIEASGFAPNADFPPGFQAVSLVPNTPATGIPDAAPNSKGTITPWHGTMVAESSGGGCQQRFRRGGNSRRRSKCGPDPHQFDTR